MVDLMVVLLVEMMDLSKVVKKVDKMVEMMDLMLVWQMVDKMVVQ